MTLLISQPAAPPTALLTYALDRPLGGIGSYTARLAAALRQAGAPPLLLKAGRLRPGEDMLALPGAGLVPGLLTLGQLEIALLVRRRRLRLVHDPTGIYPLCLAPCRTVVTLHDAFPLVTPRTSTLLENLLYRLWLPFALPRADAVITVSQHSQQDILRRLPLRKERLFVIPNAHSPAFRPLTPQQVQPVLDRHALAFPYILYVGSLEPRKNLLRLLQAYAVLRDSLPAWHLVIVGARNFWKSSPVLQTVRSLGLSAWVHFTGFVPEDDLPALYSAASLFVFPSLYEGFGLPPLEAMACGVPVVASNSTSLPEVVGDAALLVDPCDVGQIALAMQRVLSDPALAADLRQRGLARAARFTWRRMAQETLDVYRRVLES